MPDRDKDVMVFRYEPGRRIYLVSLHLENKPGALGNLANLLGVRGMNILEGFFGGMSYGEKANMSFFLETTNKMMDEKWLKEFIETSVYASDVQVKGSLDGFLADSLNFPLTWNNGDRAVMMRIEGVQAMLNAVVKANPAAGPSLIYDQGFDYGKQAWENLLLTYHPQTKEALAEMLKIYSATGWGRPELLSLDLAHRRAKLKFNDGFECMAREGRPTSTFVRGHLAGMFSVYFGSDMRATEVKCVSRGDPWCEFEISP